MATARRSTGSSGRAGSTTTKAPRNPAPPLDVEGRYRAHGRLSVGVLVGYGILLLLLLYLLTSSRPGLSEEGAWVLVGLVAFFLVRYLSTTYTIDDEYLRAWRILGGRRIRLEEVRRIDFAKLRDLAPTGGLLGLGAWGWRGRMWSPGLGEFDSVYTDAGGGLLVTAGDAPLYLSPAHLPAFARELSRRVRSYTGPLEHDVGATVPAQ